MTAQAAFDPFGRETYQMGPDADMRTWRTENGRRIYLGEKLCSGCDDPIADGPCGCVVMANEVRAMPVFAGRSAAPSGPSRQGASWAKPAAAIARRHA